jgi:hypothetical protein
MVGIPTWKAHWCLSVSGGDRSYHRHDALAAAG